MSLCHNKDFITLYRWSLATKDHLFFVVLVFLILGPPPLTGSVAWYKLVIVQLPPTTICDGPLRRPRSCFLTEGHPITTTTCHVVRAAVGLRAVMFSPLTRPLLLPGLHTHTRTLSSRWWSSAVPTGGWPAWGSWQVTGRARPRHPKVFITLSSPRSDLISFGSSERRV